VSKLVVLDPGHGGSDYGAGGNGLHEKNLTLSIALATEKILLTEYTGVSVAMTRRTDKYLTLKQRTDFSNRLNTALFVSIHINSAGATANGYESFVSPYTKSKAQLKRVHDSVAGYFRKNHGVRDRGYKQMAFYVVKNTNAPAILTESLFISNPKEANILRNNIQGIARAHAEGIASYLGLKKKATTNKGELTMSQYNELKAEIAKLRKDVQAGGALTGTAKGDLKKAFKFAYTEGVFHEDHSTKVDSMTRGEALDRTLSLISRLIEHGYLTKK